MRTRFALLLAPLDGVADEEQVRDLKDLAGSWQGWITRDQGQERATLIVSAVGSSRALTTDGASTEGKFSVAAHRTKNNRGMSESPPMPLSRPRDLDFGN